MIMVTATEVIVTNRSTKNIFWGLHRLTQVFIKSIRFSGPSHKCYIRVIGWIMPISRMQFHWANLLQLISVIWYLILSTNQIPWWTGTLSCVTALANQMQVVPDKHLNFISNFVVTYGAKRQFGSSLCHL